MDYQKRIRILREDHDLTQRQVAQLPGTSQPATDYGGECAHPPPFGLIPNLCKYS